jgi:hypothetical protein
MRDIIWRSLEKMARSINFDGKIGHRNRIPVARKREEKAFVAWKSMISDPALGE